MLFNIRIVELKDGEVINDSLNKNIVELDDKGYSPKRTAMSFLTALKLSFNN